MLQKILKVFFLACFIVLLSQPTLAETGHYVMGVEGLKAGSVPPPGFWVRTYVLNYSASSLMGGNGNEVPIGFDANVFAIVPRFIKITNIELFGGNYGFQVIVPLLNTDLSINALGLDDSRSNVGDIYIEPLIIAWHNPQLDQAVSVGMYLDTGDFDINKPVNNGKGFSTTMLTYGLTYFFDTNREWHIAALGRYEIHSKNNDTHIKAGNDFQVEWGVGKTINKLTDIGVVGYCHWQTSDDSGTGISYDPNIHDRVLGLGLEYARFWPQHMFGLSFRWLKEFSAVDRPEGNVATITLTKKF